MKLCECGCGQPTPLAPQTSRRFGWVAGEPVRFVAGHNARLKVRRTGYPVLRIKDHPRANRNGYVLEHIVIAERALGRPLPATVEVHHVDENTLNNANRNLVICQDREYHDLLHVRARVLRAGGNPNTQRLCYRCKTAKDFAAFPKSRTNKNGGVRSLCRECGCVVCREYKLRRAS
jgi:hypothetical protein